ncbi:Zn-ribbon-containing, possibly RNA-binding protein and truncated derivatives [Corynebacterium renale]|uniref:Uncharacterized protein DUF721 n=2 Tax=Corynebacterium renale TaxID=1724 RepID=A0A2A9DMP2_9CORY|nr:uncharacterized protein DUF721 [Corynebacterium renale]SQI22473.1 Zn-ribbon-containing, possibly RNA-binding protein and truncated derivatives [Corynebacterium renale]
MTTSNEPVPEQPVSDAPETPDALDAAFEAMRAAAKKRGGYVPNLRKPAKLKVEDDPSVRVPGLENVAEMDRRPVGKRRKVRGIPTGKDGFIVQRRRDMDSLGTLFAREVRKRGWNKEIAGGWVTGNWEELVGEKIAQHTHVNMIKETTLFISCDSTAWATNLRMMQRQILQAIAKKVGPNVITELKIFGPNIQHKWRKGPLHIKGRGPRDTWG